ncbi:alpha/beta hydrolase [Gilvimarinus chinensis]|uniref:alpha/beta hydrolase n=1 Tax=Gilvimarinus chinensis TaxID=396005 RepID=UPI00037EF62D|nr:alpha/beta hydrolase-fold protein [Gilvimarinus chinensis]
MAYWQQYFLSALFLVLTACGGGGSNSPSNSSVSHSNSTDRVSEINESSDEFSGDADIQEINDNDVYSFLQGEVAREWLFYSAITQTEYHVHIYLPPNYANSNAAYPIIYALDGQVLFPGLPYLIEDEGLEAILVAISEGPKDRRRTDYLLPGARDYFQFLLHELIPSAEEGLRVNDAQRTLVGSSFGGVFAGLALLMDDPVAPKFRNLLAFDASFYQHQDETEKLLRNRFQASDELVANLFLTSALPEGNDEFVSLFHDNLSEYDFDGLSVFRERIQTTHGAITEPSFRSAIVQLWGDCCSS